jgi:hypothetical protein
LVHAVRTTSTCPQKMVRVSARCAPGGRRAKKGGRVQCVGVCVRACARVWWGWGGYLAP